MPKPGKTEKQASRSERLAVALRENLKRRKAQARSRRQPLDQDSAPQSVAEGPQSGASPEFRRNPVRE
jgi:hypothetical protein